MQRKLGVLLLVFVAFTAFSTAIAHLSCILLGPQCYAVQMAPPVIVESAKAGTLLAPIGTVFVSALFGVLGLYALSAAALVRRLPLLSLGINTIAVLCTVRGILPLQLWFRHPEKVSDAVLYTGIVWLLVGLASFFGWRLVKGEPNQSHSA